MARNISGRTGWVVVAALVAAGASIASCSLLRYEPVTVRPALIPGAEYVGMSVCVTCHEKQAAEFRGAPHSAFTLAEKETAEKVVGEGCETCHGPGSLHIQDRYNKSKILKGDWRACTTCHQDKKARFNERYHHPVPEGRMSCTDCHDPHKGQRPVSRVQAVNDNCFKCHPDKRGPWAFDHDAVRLDGCTVCHEPHGTNVKKMLVADTPNLCLRCHFDPVKHPGIAAFGHSGGSYLLRGCFNCHRAVHGSNLSVHLRYE